MVHVLPYPLPGLLAALSECPPGSEGLRVIAWCAALAACQHVSILGVQGRGKGPRATTERPHPREQRDEVRIEHDHRALAGADGEERLPVPGDLHGRLLLVLGGGDVDRDGVMWVALASGHLASFDRRKCRGPLNGPNATGQHCAEGWTLYPLPGPNYKGAVESGSADSAYYNFVDRFDMLGLGRDVSLATGNESEALLALVDGKFLSFRIPYPLGFYAKGMDGRIDNPNTGWKGKGIFSTVATRAPFHMEGGKGVTSKVLKFQVRPNPLAK